MFIKWYITFSPKKELLAKNQNQFFLQFFERKPEKLGKIFFSHILLFDSKPDHNSALHAKIREKSLVIDSRIEFPNPMLMTLDRVKIIFSPLWFWIKKTKSQFRSACKNQREISSNKVGRILWSLGGEICGKRGGWYVERGKCNIESELSLLSVSSN